MAVLGPGNEYVTKNEDLIRLFDEFKSKHPAGAALRAIG